MIEAKFVLLYQCGSMVPYALYIYMEGVGDRQGLAGSGDLLMSMCGLWVGRQSLTLVQHTIGGLGLRICMLSGMWDCGLHRETDLDM